MSSHCGPQVYYLPSRLRPAVVDVSTALDGLQRAYLAVRLVGLSDGLVASDVPSGWPGVTLAVALTRPRVSWRTGPRMGFGNHGGRGLPSMLSSGVDRLSRRLRCRCLGIALCALDSSREIVEMPSNSFSYGFGSTWDTTAFRGWFEAGTIQAALDRGWFDRFAFGGRCYASYMCWLSGRRRSRDMLRNLSLQMHCARRMPTKKIRRHSRSIRNIWR